MRKLVSFELDGHDVTFVCDSRGTRSGFAHDAELFLDHSAIGSATCHYLNRTWESWIFQSACLGAVSGVIESREIALKDDYKREHGISRVAGKHKEALAEIVKSDSRISLLNKIKGTLRDRCF